MQIKDTNSVKNGQNVEDLYSKVKKRPKIGLESDQRPLRSKSLGATKKPISSSVIEDVCIYRAPGEEKLGLGLR